MAVRQNWKKRGLKLEFASAVIWPLLYLGFVATEHYGVWDKVRGLEDVKKVAAQMDSSYDPTARHQFRTGDAGYNETLSLMRRYTRAILPQDKSPVVITRYVAIASGKADLPNGKVAEWTAPTTPLYLLYHEMPTQKDDAVQVGSIEDLHSWIEQSKMDFKFYVQDIFLGVFSFGLAALLWFSHRRTD